MTKRQRRSFTPAYKAEVVELIRTSGESISAVATELDLSDTAVRAWGQQATVDRVADPAGALTTAERAERADLRRRVKTLEMEREILKKWSCAAAHPRRDESGPVPTQVIGSDITAWRQHGVWRWCPQMRVVSVGRPHTRQDRSSAPDTEPLHTGAAHLYGLAAGRPQADAAHLRDDRRPRPESRVAGCLGSPVRGILTAPRSMNEFVSIATGPVCASRAFLVGECAARGAVHHERDPRGRTAVFCRRGSDRRVNGVSSDRHG
jgi:transposase